MKKILLAVLVALGLQIQAQVVPPCDSIIVTGTQSQLTMEVTTMNTLIDYWITMGDSVVLAVDSMSTTHFILNDTPNTPISYDTLTTCITYGWGMTLTCCVTWIWDGTMWVRMGMTTGVEEITPSPVNDSKMYDLLGRELKNPLRGTLYIKNRKLYIRK